MEGYGSGSGQGRGEGAFFTRTLNTRPQGQALVVIYREFFLFFPCNHIINIHIKIIFPAK